VKITHVRPHLVSLVHCNAVYVQIVTDTDLVGIGETVLKRRDQTVVQNVREIATFLIGKDPLTIEDHFEKLYRDSFWVGGPLHAAGRSAIDIALWDDLLGGRSRADIPVYAHCPSGGSPQAFAANLLACRDRGYRAAKTTLPLFYGGNDGVDSGNGASGVAYSGLAGVLDPSLKETEFLPTRVIDQIAAFFAAGRDAVSSHSGCSSSRNPSPRSRRRTSPTWPLDRPRQSLPASA
jgi:galactonate dehydratase